jgi:hypothetical protein
MRVLVVVVVWWWVFRSCCCCFGCRDGDGAVVFVFDAAVPAC